ncbi:unnamed protein product [Rotaria sordida]|uniref:Uncharacterized protein n=1 Tax=Rotaria sordida TaxID=392033 RepID=A0A819CIM6_9BILA|nr:unnamed protein product [Rotaria sordida]
MELFYFSIRNLSKNLFNDPNTCSALAITDGIADSAHDHTYKVVWNRAVKLFHTKCWQVFTRRFLPYTLRAIPINGFTYPVYVLLK